jgi:hypothetical protein
MAAAREPLFEDVSVMKVVHVAPELVASGDNELTSMLRVGAEMLPRHASDDELAEVTAIIEDMNSRDLKICSHIVQAVREKFERAGAPATNMALEQALREIARASMI